jgi:hypothetical protein
MRDNCECSAFINFFYIAHFFLIFFWITLKALSNREAVLIEKGHKYGDISNA